MNSGITSRLAIAPQFGLQDRHEIRRVEAGGRKVVFDSAGRVQDGARPKTAKASRAAGGGLGQGDVGLAGGELLHAAADSALVFADQGDGRLDFGHHAHVAEQLFGPAQILAHGKEQRQPAFDVFVDVGLAMLDLGGVDHLAVDTVAEHGFDIVVVGQNAKTGRWIAHTAARRDDLIGLDKAKNWSGRNRSGNGQ